MVVVVAVEYRHVGVVAVFVELKPHADLFEIVHAGGLHTAAPGLVQRGKQDGGEDRDDRDYDEEFNQRENSFHFFLPIVQIVV